MIGLALLLVKHTLPDILPPNGTEVREPKPGITAEHEHIPEAAPLWVGRQVCLVQGLDLRDGEIYCIRLLVPNFEIGKVDGGDDLPPHAIPDEDPQLLDGRPNGISL